MSKFQFLWKKWKLLVIAHNFVTKILGLWVWAMLICVTSGIGVPALPNPGNQHNVESIECNHCLWFLTGKTNQQSSSGSQQWQVDIAENLEENVCPGKRSHWRIFEVSDKMTFFCKYRGNKNRVDCRLGVTWLETLLNLTWLSVCQWLDSRYGD